MTTAPETSSKILSVYATTHCATCKAGWVRENERGEILIVCLLDREPVWHQLAECNKFEARPAPKPAAV